MNETKAALRERAWDELERSGEARFPFPPHGRIPNFADAGDAAERLTTTEQWEDADVVKANPDAPQRPVRKRALQDGKTVYMAVPRLDDDKPFLRLDPETIDDHHRASTIGGSAELGEQVGPAAVEPIDLVVSGSVAVDEDGGRVGKGEGYSDLEFAILRELGLLDAPTVVTTVHERQVVDRVPVDDHDVPIDLVVTPDRTIETAHDRERPAGIDWDQLDDDRLTEIPVLNRLDRER